MASIPTLIAGVFVALLSIHIARTFKATVHSRLWTRLWPKEFPRLIAPLWDFDLHTTPPEKLWTFKEKYHMTMSLQRIDPDNLILMDQTYVDRVKMRRAIMCQHQPAITRACLPAGEKAVLELYTWLVKTYLPQRFPTIYEIHPDATHLCNSATGSIIPVRPESPLVALERLGETVDSEFFLLLPRSQSVSEVPVHDLQAYICCFANGFDPREKLGLPLASIHATVPGYKAKLEKSMDRFFAKIECGKVYKRINWSINTSGDDLFMQSSHTYHDGRMEEEEEKAEIIERKKSILIENCRLRCERQTVHRLPHSRAIVFAFKTYMHTLHQVKEDGKETAESLVRAIDGLQLGSVPEIYTYKSGIVWGDTIKEFLLS